MTNKILMITEKFCDGQSSQGLTNNYHNLFGSFKRSYPEIPFNVLHFDESLVEHKTHIDKIIPKVYEKLKPNIIMISLMGKYNGNPSKESLKFLKDKGCKICVHWPDVGLDWGYPQVLELTKEFVDLHVGWDQADSEFHRTRQMPDNFVQLFVPQDPKLYFKNSFQDVQISFIGSPRYQDRQIYLNHAINVNRLPILVKGGQREEKLSADQYSQLIRRSKIGINFSLSPGSFQQLKGRVYEILASHSMLLESKNEATSKLFKPGYDYIEFADPNDFVEKCKYYMNHLDEANKIASQGYKTYNEKYSAKIFWKTIFDKLGVKV